MSKYILLFVIFLFTCSVAVSQQYVTVTASSSKKDYTQSEPVKINVKATVQSGFHINANKISDEDLIPTTVKVEGNDFKLIKTSWPASEKYKFSFSETELEVYAGSFNIGLTLKTRKDLKPGKYEIKGAVNYQACNDRACFPPKDAEFSVTVNIKEDTAKTSADTSKKEIKSEETEVIKDTTKKADTTKQVSAADTTKKTALTENKRDTTQTITSTGQNEIAGYIQEKGLFLTLILIFIGGLALNLTPCVYPLIPITISFFGAQVSNSKSQKIVMAIVYVLGMSITYSVLGLVAALTGGLFGSLLQNPIVVAVIVLILLALALSMFGLYEIRIPQSIASFSGKNRQGYVGTVLMGLTVGFIAAPCIGPFVLGLLVYVGQIGNAFLGFLMFFILSMGLGFPYIFLAIFSGSITKLPRSGEWMEGVKIIFGFVMVGLAIYIAQPLLTVKVYEIVFPVFLILAGFYLIVIDRKAINASVYTRIKYVIAIGSVVAGSMNLHFKEEQPLAAKLQWQNLSSQQQIDSSISKAGKPTIIDFYADWCAQCKELDKYTYTDPKVIELSKNFNNIKVDLTKENEQITNKFKILGLPVVAFLDKNGKENEDLRITGFLKPDEFTKTMEKALNK
jgi:thiol:disulfide interchange protein DsbD